MVFPPSARWVRNHLEGAYLWEGPQKLLVAIYPDLAHEKLKLLMISACADVEAQRFTEFFFEKCSLDSFNSTF